MSDPITTGKGLDISPETMKSIKQFLLKTSVPRIIEAKRKKEESA